MTGRILMEQFCWWGLFLMLELWEDASPRLEEDLKPIFVPVISPLDAALEEACTQLYNDGLDMDNFSKCTCKKCTTPTKGPIAKRTQSKRAKEEEEEEENEARQEEKSPNDNDEGEEEEEEEPKPVQKCKKCQTVQHLCPPGW